MQSNCRRHGGFEFYQDALAYLESKDRKTGHNRLRGSVFLCPDCENYHISSRNFTLVKRTKGRGKYRRRMVQVARW